jgi:pimeloyl-ACP methyl ester carboxylesterase
MIRINHLGLTSMMLFLFHLAFSAQDPDKPDMHACIPCEEIKNLDFPELVITEAVTVTDKTTYCKVLGIIGKEINFELLLPGDWNGRFFMGGGGGFVGSVANGARWSVHDGYATSGTDTGHKGHGLQADWALDNMERQINFGHLAIHRTALFSKAIIARYYCHDPEYSYFMGCSRGGGQAMMEAQRYPEDFDGIIAGAPAFNWPSMAAEFIQNIQAIYPDPNHLEEPVITQKNLAMLQEAVLAQCDELDGVKDGILNDPTACDFDLSALPACPDDVIGEDCFTISQLKAIQTVYGGIASDQGEIYPGFPPGGENEAGGWMPWITGPNEGSMELGFPSLQFGFGTEMFKYLFLQDPEWDYSTYDFSDFFEKTHYASAYLDATSSDYSDFKKRKGKMIIYHGWNDPALSAYATIEHYKALEARDPAIRDYVRLFLLPGVLHCSSGPGPDKTDWIGLLRDWVENGNAPDRVVMSKVKDGEVTMTRPVFPYPRKAIYDGKGDPNNESSFK